LLQSHNSLLYRGNEMTRIQIEAILLASPLDVKVGVLLGRQEVVSPILAKLEGIGKKGQASNKDSPGQITNHV